MNPHFATLVVGLASQAEAALSGTLPPDLLKESGGNARQLAQTLIDTIAMLEAKTQGHLDAAEQKLLADALTALRFRFVQTR
ncbi:MAG: DUF1844 domain-containing protein [Gemmatimonadota bacterium]